MNTKLKSTKGLFGQTIRYRNGIKIGESWPGILGNMQNHYDADGRYLGYSVPGVIADAIHYDEHGSRIGETYTGIFNERRHYDADCRFVGDTWDTFTGEETYLPESGNGTDEDAFCDDIDW